VQAVEKAGLHQETRVGPPGIGPGVFVAGALDLPDHVDPPALRSIPGLAQALETNPHLYHIAGIGQTALRFPDVIRVLVGSTTHQASRGKAALRPYPILLRTQRVHREEEGPPAVVERVEVDGDSIVGVEVVPGGYRGSDSAGLALIGDYAEVNRVGRVPHQHDRSFLGGPAVDWLVLMEIGESGGLGPNRLVQLPVDGDGSLEAGRRGKKAGARRIR